MHDRKITNETQQDIVAVLFRFHVSSYYKQFFPEYDSKKITEFVGKNATKDAFGALFKNMLR